MFCYAWLTRYIWWIRSLLKYLLHCEFPVKGCAIHCLFILSAKLYSWMSELCVYWLSVVKGQGTVISLSARRNMILRHPIAVSGETATCAQVVAKRANTVGLLLVRHKRFKPGPALLPNKLVPLPVELSTCSRGVYIVPQGLCSGGPLWRKSGLGLLRLVWNSRSKRIRIRVKAQVNFYKGMFFVMLMKFFLVVST